MGLVLGLAAVGVVAAAWRKQAREAGPVNRRTIERLRPRAA